MATQVKRWLEFYRLKGEGGRRKLIRMMLEYLWGV